MKILGWTIQSSQYAIILVLQKADYIWCNLTHSWIQKLFFIVSELIIYSSLKTKQMKRKKPPENLLYLKYN